VSMWPNFAICALALNVAIKRPIMSRVCFMIWL
jgi:hypothetical protein